MKNLKQLLTERKYLEAKTLVLEDRENLEESIDTLMEAVEDARTNISYQTIREGADSYKIKNASSGNFNNDYYARSLDDCVKVTIGLSAATPPEVGQAFYWNDDRQELECRADNSDMVFQTGVEKVEHKFKNGIMHTYINGELIPAQIEEPKTNVALANQMAGTISERPSWVNDGYGDQEPTEEELKGIAEFNEWEASMKKIRSEYKRLGIDKPSALEEA